MGLSPEFMLKIILAGALSSIVGIERAQSGRSAGVRTNLMIAVTTPKKRSGDGWKHASCGLSFTRTKMRTKM